MKLKIIFRDIPNWKEEYVQKDFTHFFAEMKFQMMLMLERIEKNKGVQARLINRLKNTKTWKTDVLNLQILLEGIAGADIGSVYFTKENNNNFVVIFEMNEFYFEMIDALKHSGQGFFGYGLVDKKQLLKDFSKAFRKNITHKFTIQQLE